MNAVRILILLLSGMLMAMTFAPGGASATEGIEAENQFGGPCAPFYCQFHVDGESHFARLDTGAIVSTCQDEWAVALNDRAHGDITWSGAAHGAPGCNVTRCVSAWNPWKISNSEEIAPGQVEFSTNTCFRNIVTGVESSCVLDIVATRTFTDSYHFDTTTICFPAAVRVEFEAAIEPGIGIEIHHL